MADQTSFNIAKGPNKWGFLMESLDRGEPVKFTLEGDYGDIEITITGMDRVIDPEARFKKAYSCDFKGTNSFGKKVRGFYDFETEKGFVEYMGVKYIPELIAGQSEQNQTGGTQ